jgi:hypothetical protein
MKTLTHAPRDLWKVLGLALLLTGFSTGKASAKNEIVTIPMILADYYGWAYTEAFTDHADIFGWSTAGVDALGWSLVLVTPDYDGRVAGLFFVNVAGMAKTAYPLVALLGTSDAGTRERAWIALGTHTVNLLSLELLGRPALSIQSAMGPRQDATGLTLTCRF